MNKEEYKRQNEERDKKNDAQSFRERWFGWWKTPSDRFAALIALFTAVLAFVAWRQLAAMRSADDKIGDQVRAVGRQLSLMEADQRPWVFARGVSPWSALLVSDEKVQTTLQFELYNSGKSPARFVTIQGAMFPTSASQESVLKSWNTCAEYRKTIQYAGAVIFPSVPVPQNHVFTMDAADTAVWKTTPADKPNTLIVVGCVDYLVADEKGEPRHHQSQFVYEVDKPRHDRSFERIPTENAVIPASDIVLANNPTIPKDAD
jgi:hypothetical protein